MGGSWVVGLRPRATGGVAEPCCPRALVAASVAVLGPGPVAWAAEVARSVESKVAGFTPDITGPSSVELVRRPIEACTLALLETLHADSAAAHVRVPELVIAGNRELVHRGVPLDRLLRAIWTAHAYAHQQLVAFLEQDTGPASCSSEVGRATELSFAYAEALTARLTADFTTERDAWLDTVPALQRQVVDDLLTGRTPSARNPDRVLRLDLDRHLAAAVVWTDPDQAGAPADPARTAAALATAAGAGSSLVVPVTRSTTWLWTAFPGGAPRRLAATLRDGVPAPAGTGVALGPVRAGVDGFRQSHLAALRVRRLGAALATPGGPWLFDHAELDLLALLTDDPDQAAWFVRDHLGGLAEGGRRTAQLRETLRLYLRFGRSRAAAAEALHVVPNTVAYRVRQAEELLGADIPRDALHLRVALEICDLVDAGDQRAGPGRGPQERRRPAAR